MKLKIRKSNDRGHANLDWLDSRFSFSFAEYHDPEHMGFRTLRVINQDKIAPKGGFPWHPHRDMEIFSYVLEGELKHQDSMGNGRTLKPGEIQLMSAGSGVLHSEYNPSSSVTTHMLQIWIRPSQSGLKPSYTEWKPSPNTASQSKVLLISGDGRDDSALIHQDADVWRVRLDAGQFEQLELREGRGAWLQITKGHLEVNGVALGPGDAVNTQDPGSMNLVAAEETELLFFDLA